MEGSSEGNNNLVEQFCTITGADRSVAESLLSFCNQSLEMAINMHMEGVVIHQPTHTSSAGAATAGPSHRQTGVKTSKAAKANSQPEDPILEVDDEEEQVREPIPQKQETLIEPDMHSFSLRSSAASVHQGRIRSVFDGFRNFSNEAKSYEMESNGSSSSSSSSSSRKRGKKRTLEELFKPPIDLMYKGDWKSVRDAASSAKKWLMVNIQDAGEFACQILNRDVWSSEAVRTILCEHFVFWQQYKESDEAQRYMTFYPVTEWPHVAVIDPRTGERLVCWSQIPDASTFCDLVSEFLCWHPTLDGKCEAESSKKRRKSEEPEVLSMIDASEDDQLAAAIQASLAESKAKSSQTLDCSDCDTLFTDDDTNMSAIVCTSSNGKNQLESDPEPSTAETTDSWTDYLGLSSDEQCSFNIRFPSGKKELLQIPCSSKLKAIVKYVTQLGFPLDQFEIVSNFPRRILSDLDQDQSLKNLGLSSRETIFVQQKQ